MRVLLAHGLGRSRFSMLLLGHRLARAGFQSEYFSYSPVTETHASIIARLVARLQVLARTGEEVGLIGHSFGGLLFRQALAKVQGLKVRHLVMLGTPNQLPRLGRFYKYPPLNLLRGDLGSTLANRKWFDTLPGINVPYTIVSGTKGWRGRWSPFQSELNDGIVAVAETILSDRDQPVLVPSLHTFIMNDRMVTDLIEARFSDAYAVSGSSKKQGVTKKFD